MGGLRSACFKSRKDPTLAPSRESMHSFIFGMVYERVMVLAFKFLYYTQKRGIPSVFATSTTGLAHSNMPGSMALCAVIRFYFAFYELTCSVSRPVRCLQCRYSA